MKENLEVKIEKDHNNCWIVQNLTKIWGESLNKRNISSFE